MTNTGNLGTIEAANPVLTVAPLKEDTEMLRATEKITALYCRLSVEDLKDDKNGGKGDVSNSMRQLPQQHGNLFSSLHPGGCTGRIGLDAHENGNLLCNPA